MNSEDHHLDAIMATIRRLARQEAFRVTQHAGQEMVAEDIALDDVLAAIESGGIIENYPEHRRGACCLVHGTTGSGRHLHVVCTTAPPTLIIITVYEPKPPKWPTPTTRRGSP